MLVPNSITQKGTPLPATASDSSISKSIDKSTFTKLDYFKKKLIDILVSQENEENQNIEKAVKANISGNIKVNSLRSFHDKRCESFFDFWNKKQVLFEDKEKTKALREFLHVRGFDSSSPSSETSISKPINKSNKENRITTRRSC